MDPAADMAVDAALFLMNIVDRQLHPDSSPSTCPVPPPGAASDHPTSELSGVAASEASELPAVALSVASELPGAAALSSELPGVAALSSESLGTQPEGTAGTSGTICPQGSSTPPIASSSSEMLRANEAWGAYVAVLPAHPGSVLEWSQE